MAANCAPVCKYSSIFCSPVYRESGHTKEFRPKLGIISAHSGARILFIDLILNSRHTTTSNRESAERVLIIDAAARGLHGDRPGHARQISRPRLFEFLDGAQRSVYHSFSCQALDGEGLMMQKKGPLEEVQTSLVDAAKTSTEGVRTLAGEALGAAAAAAAGVVMNRVAQVLGKGEQTVTDTAPAAQNTVQQAVVSAVGPSKEKRVAIKRKLARTKKPTVKKPANVAKTKVTKAAKKRVAAPRKKR
jgi:hypothetical protein